MTRKNLTWLEISSRALRHNVLQFRTILPANTGLMAVVKSNAYGHGLVECSKVFSRAGCTWLGTVNLSEALALRRAGLRTKILVLSFYEESQLAAAITSNIRLTVYSYQTARQLSQWCKKLKRTARIHIKIDTGTSRLGLPVSEALPIIAKITALPRITVEGIFTHLADAENPNQIVTKRQIKAFDHLLHQLSLQGIFIPLQHMACSAAALLNNNAVYSLVRPGISLYGLWSIEKNGTTTRRLYSRIHLQPSLSWHTTVLQVKSLPAGSTVGYGCTYHVRRPMKIALVPVGYWDGLDRRLSNRGSVLIKGKRCPIRGRICMNLTMVEVTDIRNVRPGDRATLIGRQGREQITIDEIAKIIGTINYEVAARINPLIPRVYT